MKYLINNKYLFLSLLLLISCDVDRFFGYNQEADEQLESTNVFGNVTNIFTGEAVDRANIHIGNVVTQSDNDGRYFIKYALGEDENRDAPVSILIIVPKYYDYEDEVLLYPLSNEYNFELVRGAPIVVESALASEYPDEPTGGLLPVIWCQVHVRDYQGINNINKVTSTVYYSQDLVKSIEYLLEFKKSINKTDAYYQLLIPSYVEGYGILTYFGGYTVRAYDNDGFVEVYPTDSHEPPLLFPPRWD